MRLMTQRAPYPETLEKIIETFNFKPGWRFKLTTVDRDNHKGWHKDLTPEEVAEVPEEHCVGLTLLIWPATTNSYSPTICPASEGRVHKHILPDYAVVHLMPVPAATYNEMSWRSWLMDQITLVERHETFEFAQFDGVRFFAPIHAPGFDPYMTTTVGVSEIDRRTSFRGELNPQ